MFNYQKKYLIVSRENSFLCCLEMSSTLKPTFLLYLTATFGHVVTLAVLTHTT